MEKGTSSMVEEESVKTTRNQGNLNYWSLLWSKLVKAYTGNQEVLVNHQQTKSNHS